MEINFIFINKSLNNKFENDSTINNVYMFIKQNTKYNFLFLYNGKIIKPSNDLISSISNENQITLYIFQCNKIYYDNNERLVSTNEFTQMNNQFNTLVNSLFTNNFFSNNFNNQLSILNDMGFYDNDRNTQALVLSSGNIDLAISYLFDETILSNDLSSNISELSNTNIFTIPFNTTFSETTTNLNTSDGLSSYSLTSDGVVSDNVASDNGVSDNVASDGASDNGASDNGASDNGASDGVESVCVESICVASDGVTDN